jgi:hypothetical protein
LGEAACIDHTSAKLTPQTTLGRSKLTNRIHDEKVSPSFSLLR